MSAAFGNGRRNRTRSPSGDRSNTSILAKVGKSELKLLRVAVKRSGSNHIGGGPQLPLERNIDDPARICAYVHYRRDENKRLQPPIFGRGIKVNQDFTENRQVFTHEKSKTSRKARSRSKNRSRSPRIRFRSPRNRSRSPRNRSRSQRNRSRSPINRSRSPINRSRSPRNRSISPRNRSRSPRNRARSEGRRGASQENTRNERKRSGSRSSTRKKTSGRRDSSRRGISRERKDSSERRRYKDDSHRYSGRRSRHSRSSSRSIGPHEHEPSCPMYDRRDYRKSLTPLRPGEYRPGHPDLAFRNKTQRSRSRSNDDRSRSKKSCSRDDVPSTSRARSSPGRNPGSSKTSGPYQSVGRRDRREQQSNSRSPTKKNRSPRRRSRSPQYGEYMHGDLGYYAGWGPGPRLPVGRGGYPMQPFFAPTFHPRGMMPGPMIPPGHMIVPRMPIIPPYGPYRPHLPIYNSGAVRQRISRPQIKPSTITSENDKDGDGESGKVVITEASSPNAENEVDNAKSEETDKNQGREAGGEASEYK